MLALELYDLACPWGELDYKGLELSLDMRGIKGRRRAALVRNVLFIYRLVKKHYGSQQQSAD